MSAIQVFEPTKLESLCNVLADTSTGLTGSEIGKLLRQLGIDDPHSSDTKRTRLYQALYSRQLKDRSGNLVAAFIQAAMDPVRHTGASQYFEDKRHELNEVLAFAGYLLGEDGKFRHAKPATTLTEAQARAGRLPWRKSASRESKPRADRMAAAGNIGSR